MLKQSVVSLPTVVTAANMSLQTGNVLHTPNEVNDSFLYVC